jgi:hypothetical protein
LLVRLRKRIDKHDQNVLRRKYAVLLFRLWLGGGLSFCNAGFFLPSFPHTGVGDPSVPHAAGMPSPNPRLNALGFMVAAIVTQGATYLSKPSSEPPHQLPRCHTKCTGRDSRLQFKIPPPRAIEWFVGITAVSHHTPSCHSYECHPFGSNTRCVSTRSALADSSLYDSDAQQTQSGR